MTWRDLLIVKVQGSSISMQVGWPLLLTVSVVIIAAFLAFKRKRRRWRVKKVNFRFAGIGSVELCPNDDVAQLAHTAWVEIQSRKAAIPFDPKYDVVVEVYNSYYDLFKALRDLAKTVPVDSIEAGRSEPLLSEILLKVLNVGLRPHLTRWQAEFRRWYEAELTKDSSKSIPPQEIQRRFTHYEELVADLARLSVGMCEFSDALRQVAHEREMYSIRRRITLRKKD